MGGVGTTDGRPGVTLDRTTILAGIPRELSSFSVLVAGLDEDQLSMPSRCAGWTVRDVAGHVVGIVADLAAGRLEGQGTPEVTGRQAAERAGSSGPALAEELEAATPGLLGLLESLPEEAWRGPSFDDPRYTLGFAIEALWFDAYLHADDVRAALGAPSERGPGLRCAVHHVAGYLDARGWGPATLALEGLEAVDVGGGGGEVIGGDPLRFVLAATGRVPAEDAGLDPSINVYAD